MQQNSPNAADLQQQMMWPRQWQQNPQPVMPWPPARYFNNTMPSQSWTVPYGNYQHMADNVNRPQFYPAYASRSRIRNYCGPMMMSPYASPFPPRGNFTDVYGYSYLQRPDPSVARGSPVIPSPSDGFFRSPPRPRLNAGFIPRPDGNGPKSVVMTNMVKPTDEDVEQYTKPAAELSAVKSSSGHSGGVMYRNVAADPYEMYEQEFISKQYRKEHFYEVMRRGNVDISSLVNFTTTAEAACAYIDFLVMENRQRVYPFQQVSENEPKVSYEDISRDPYATEVINRRTEYPTRKFNAYLGLFGLSAIKNETRNKVRTSFAHVQTN